MSRRSPSRNFPRLAQGYVLLLLAGVVAVAPSATSQALERPLEALIWIVIFGVTSFLTIPMLPNARVEADLGQPVIAAAAVLLPPPLVVLVSFVGLTNERMLRRDTSPWFSLFNKAQMAISTGAASFAAGWIVDRLGESAPALFAATGAAILIQDLVSVALISTLFSILGRMSWSRAFRAGVDPFPRFGSSFLLVGLLAVPVVLAYDAAGELAIVLVALPLGLGYNAMRSAKESEDRARELAQQVRELEILNSLGGQLLSVSSREEAGAISQLALRRALENGEIAVALDGRVPEGLRAVAVLGADPAALGVPRALSEGSAAVVEAVGGLLGITLQRVALSEQLAEVQRARVALAGRILEEGTRERSRIALEIHDDVLPFLAAAEIQADNVRSAVGQDDLQVADRLAAATRNAINGGIAQLREVLDALRKQIIVPGGLVPGLREALDDLRVHHGVRGSLDVPQELPTLPLAVEILVLETVRGCLTNVARHAGAEHVEVRLDFTDSSVSASVCDDGKGFDPDAVPEGHHGLSLMAQRVELARGTFAVTSATGAGTRVQMEVPL